MAAQGEDEAWRRITSRLSPELCAAIDRLLDVGEDAHRSTLFQLKQARPRASPPAILDYLERFARLQALGAGLVDLAGIMLQLVKDLAEGGERYDVDDLKRFAPAKRYALVACFLVEKHKTTIDYLVEMNRQWIPR